MKRQLLLLLTGLMTVCTQAQKFSQEFGNPRKVFVETIVTPDHADSYYSIGQTATLRVIAREGGAPVHGTMLRYKVGPEMLLPEAFDSVAFVNGEALVRIQTERHVCL